MMMSNVMLMLQLQTRPLLAGAASLILPLRVQRWAFSDKCIS